MAQFNINWFNAAVIINPNATAQRVSHRQKSVGGAFTTTGYTPLNDLPTSASASLSPVLANNIVWEFKVEAICTEGGPEANTNGNQEGLKFACLVPSLTFDTDSAQIVLNVAGTDITAATFILRRVDDNTAVDGPTTVARVGTGITREAEGIDPGTDYYWEIIQYAIVNGSQIASNDASQLGASCFSIDFTTTEDTCLPVTDLDISSIDIT